jgi:hypothetical protein
MKRTADTVRLLQPLHAINLSYCHKINKEANSISLIEN